MRCPHCQSDKGTKVIDTTHDQRGGVRRRRECKQCTMRFSTYERAILATPLVIKEDGTREEFESVMCEASGLGTGPGAALWRDRVYPAKDGEGGGPFGRDR